MKSSQTPHRRVTSTSATRHWEAYTLFEVLIAVTIMTVLSALAIVSMSSIHSKAKQVQCVGNLHQIGLAVLMYGADYGVYVPCLTDTSEWSYLLKPYLDKTGNVYSDPNDRSAVIVCPSRTLTTTNLQTTYAAHRKVLVITSGPDFGVPLKISNLPRPTEIAILGDAMQLPAYEGGRCMAAYDFQHDPDWTLTGDPASRDNVVNSDDADANGVGENIRYRHQGHGNMLFADGHVESLAKDTLKERNVMINY